MKERPLIDLGMTGYDELFMNDTERREAALPKIYNIPLSEIDDFPDHPFQVRLDEDMRILKRANSAIWIMSATLSRAAPMQ